MMRRPRSMAMTISPRAAIRLSASVRSGEPGLAAQGNREHEFPQSVERPQVALAARPGELARLAGRQQPAAEEHEEQHAPEQGGSAHRQEVEKLEPEIALLRERRADQEVGRGSDLGGEAAEQASE